MSISIGARITFLLVFIVAFTAAAEDWTQFKFDNRHSGNVPDRSVSTPLKLIGTIPLTDAVFTAPVVEDGRIYVVDGSGVAFCIDASTLRVVWKFASEGRKANCNNVSSPAIAGKYLHFGTMTGNYYVLDKATGRVVRKINCDEPIFSAPVVVNDKVYFATLGSRVYSLTLDGTINWEYDFIKEHLGFSSDRWSGEDWLAYKNGRVSWEDQFLCSRDLVARENMIVLPAGSMVAWIEDTGNQAVLQAIHQQKRRATFGLTLDEDGTVYWQWVQKDNTGRVDRLRLHDGIVETDYIRGTQAGRMKPSLLCFCSVSLRGQDVYRCYPEENLGLCKHIPGLEKPVYLGGYPSIASPVLLRENAIYGGLDGGLYVVSLSGNGKMWSFKTAFGKAISAPVAVCDGHIYFGCEDGYLYILGPEGDAPSPTRNLELCKIRSPLKSKFTDPRYDRFTSFANWGNTNVIDQKGLRPPFKLKWIRRYKGTIKHFSTCGGGRLYTHTAEGQVFAVEQETGRLLWRKFFPGVHISYTTPLYYKGRILVPQAGFEKCRLRCLDAATGELLWEAPFAGSPSWNRQIPPIVYDNIAIYQFSTGAYKTNLNEDKMSWLKGIQDIPSFPKNHKPQLRAWNIETGEQVWNRDFSEFGSGGDEAGMCLLDSILYYSCYFGHSARIREGLAGPKGITASIDPQTGQIIWLTTKYYLHSGCTISGKDGRLYLGGYNPVNYSNDRPLHYKKGGGNMIDEETGKRLYTNVWCLDARDGSLVWESDDILGAIHVVTISDRFLFVHAQYKNGYLLDKQNGKILTNLTKSYRCTRFNCAGNYLLGSNMDVIDLSDIHDVKLVTSGPALDIAGCMSPIISNGRMFYTSAGAGMQASKVYGEEAESIASP